MQVTGRAFIKHNGQLFRSQNGAKLMYGNNERTTVIGDNGVHGFTEKPGEPKIECTVSHTAETSLEELAAITDASITFETDTGKVYIVRNAWLANSLELTANENGELPLEFAGMSCEEV
mgnify:CR=1 FL=1